MGIVEGWGSSLRGRREMMAGGTCASSLHGALPDSHLANDAGSRIERSPLIAVFDQQLALDVRLRPCHADFWIE